MTDKFIRELYQVTGKTHADDPNPQFQDVMDRLAIMANIATAEDDDERAIAGIARKHLLKYHHMIGYMEFTRENITNLIMDDVLAQERQVRKQVEDFLPILFDMMDDEDQFRRYGMLSWSEV